MESSSGGPGHRTEGSLIPVEKPMVASRFRWALAARWLVAVGAIGTFIASSGVLVAGPARDAPAPDPRAEPQPRTVTASPVEPSSVRQTRRYYGVVRAAERAALSFTMGGRLIERRVDVGDRVEQGAVVARVDPQPLANAVAAHRASLAELEARLALRERERKRDVDLFAAGAIADAARDQSDSAVQTLKAAREATEVNLRESRRLLAEASLTAPFAGVVVEAQLEPGEYARPGVPVVTLSGSGRLEVDLEVPESVVLALPPGEAVTVDLPLAEEMGVEGRVRSVGTASAGTGLFPVLIDLGAPETVRAGMTAEVAVPVKLPQALTVPVAAILDPSGRRPIVLVVRHGHAYRIPVKIGPIQDDRVIVNGQLGEGDLVVTGGHTFLLDGDPVEVK